MSNVRLPANKPFWDMSAGKVATLSSTLQSEYGTHLPGSCPPPQAIYGPKLLFRLVHKERFAEEDFKTTDEEGTFPNGDPCQRCAISTQASVAEARKMRRLVPNLAARKIACGVVPAQAGVLLNTPSRNSQEHWSWWPKANIVRHSYFELLDEAA